MPRLIRIALSLFAAAIIMVYLSNQEVKKLKVDQQAGIPVMSVEQTERKIYLGYSLAVVMGTSSLVLLFVSIAQMRKREKNHE